MKNILTLCVVLFFQIFAFSQLAFAPLGAKWGGYVTCFSPNPFGCPPLPPIVYSFTVTEDTVIQGKYCTRLRNGDWPCTPEKTYVHQDGYLIFRYDIESQEFKLVLDFSKQVGESWKVEAPCGGASPDTITITVLEVNGIFRRVSMMGMDFLELYEGFGGVLQNKRLLFAIEFFYFFDPAYDDLLTCYEDPAEGVLYGDVSGCNYNATEEKSNRKQLSFSIFPNPAHDDVTLNCSFPLAKAGEWLLSDPMGKVIQKEHLFTGKQQQAFSIDGIVPGLYFWQVQVEGRRLGSGKLVIAR